MVAIPAAPSAEIVNCDPVTCFGYRNYAKSCQDGEAEYKTFCSKPGNDKTRIEQCQDMKQALIKSCTCAKNCGKAVCSSWPANATPQERCFEATWR